MSYSAKILLDSISETGKRITTYELKYPRMIHSEFMTHRMFSRNAASSRAIPAKRMRQMVKENPFVPDKFPKNVAGMQPAEWFEQNSEKHEKAKVEWLAAADVAMSAHEYLEIIGVHKQIANRLLEPFLWYTCIVTATEFDNFFKLRCDENAQYEIRRIADLMYEAYHCYDEDQVNADDWIHFPEIKSVNGEWQAIRPQKLKVGEWHCPLVYEEDKELIAKYVFYHSGTSSKEVRKQISVARCARVSYLTHDGKRDIEKDLELFNKLVGGEIKHMSPFEHAATPYFAHINDDAVAEVFKEGFQKDGMWINKRSGNFIGWKQYRKEFADENCKSFRKE